MTVVVGPKGQRYAIHRKGWPLAGAMGNAGNLGFTVGARGRQAINLIGQGRTFTYGQLFRNQLWVHAAVTKLARGVSRLPLKTYEWEDEEAGDRKRVRDHPLPHLLSRPYTRGSGRDLRESIVGHVAIYGNALLAKWRPGPGRPVEELWPVPWRFVNVIPGEKEPILAYEFNGPSKRLVFLPEDVVHFRWWEPDGTGLGVSPLEPLAETLGLEDAAKRYGMSSFANAARPAGAFVTSGTLRPDKKEELQAQLNAVWSGPDNAYKTLLLDAGLDWKSISHTAEQAQMIELRKLDREEVCAAYDIPPPILHILDHATFSNIDEQHLMWYADTLGPWLSLIEDTLAVQLLDGERAFAGLFNEHDLSDVLKGDPLKRADAYSKFLTSGTYTINELRKLENLSRIDHPLADAVFVPLNYSPVAEGLDGPAGDGNVGQAALDRIEANRLALVSQVLGLKESGHNGNGHLTGEELAARLREAGMTVVGG